MTPARPIRPFARLISFVALATLSAACLPGCSVLSSTSNGLVSLNTGDSLSPTLPVRVYSSRDRSSADFYLTDLPESLWDLQSDLRDTSGVIIHVSMFIEPKSGKTPIATSAVSGTVRYLILSKGEVGLYGGAGFIDIDGTPGDPELSATMRDASLRLVRATPGFRDRIVNGSFSLKADATKNPESVDKISAMMEALQNEASLTK